MNDERHGNGLNDGAGSPDSPRSTAERGGATGATSLGEFLEAGPGGSLPPPSPSASAGDGPRAAAVESPQFLETRPLRFTGNGPEYFRIWIVNVVLTLLTLGVYSAWAKVRTRRYLYGNVWLDDAAFDYTANPVVILRGRILVAIVAVLLWFAQVLSPLYYVAALLVLMPLVPWVVVRARSFQLRNSRYRGIAFDFQGRYRDAAVWYPLSWIGSVATLGLARPFTVFGRDRFLVTESRFGKKRFGFVGQAGRYYLLYGVTVVVGGAIYIGGTVVLMGVLVATVGMTVASDADAEPAVPDMSVFFLGIAILVAALFLFVLAYLRSRLLSYRWSSSRLGKHEFRLDLSFLVMLWLYASNAVAIITTLGLFTPFARIRVARYVVNQFQFLESPAEGAVEAGKAQRLGATGAEAAGEFGLEIGI